MPPRRHGSREAAARKGWETRRRPSFAKRVKLLYEAAAAGKPIDAELFYDTAVELEHLLDLNALPREVYDDFNFVSLAGPSFPRRPDVDTRLLVLQSTEELRGDKIDLGLHDEFVESYINTAFWSTNDESDERGGKPLDDNYSEEDLDLRTYLQMRHDCWMFQRQNVDALDDAQLAADRAGHMFWLSRNGYGTGFCDEVARDSAFYTSFTQLHEAAKAFGEYHLVVGDDGKIYGM